MSVASRIEVEIVALFLAVEQWNRGELGFALHHPPPRVDYGLDQLLLAGVIESVRPKVWRAAPCVAHLRELHLLEQP
jgi:hypothetical protein